MPELLGDRIRKARLHYGMSQAELSRRIGITRNAMNDIERNRVLSPGSLTLAAIADVLHVSTDELLGRERSDELTAAGASPGSLTPAA